MLPNGTIHEVARYSSRELAELHRTILEERGVEAFVAADDCGGTWGGLTAVQGARLLVAESQLEQARQILAEHASVE